MRNQDQVYLDLFRQELEVRNYSARTIETYFQLLVVLSRALNKPLEEIHSEDLKSYLHNRITQEGVSTSTVNQSISAFKLLQTGVLHREWAGFMIKRPRREKRLPTVLSVEEVEALINACSNMKHRALLMLAYSAGLRRNEVAQLRPADIDSARMQVIVRQGKGKKDRHTILSQKVLAILRVYWKMYHPKEYLFETQVKQGRQYASTTLNQIVKSCAERAGIRKPLSFHTLRHSFATHLLESGVNIRYIQQLLGHTNIKTTSVYLHVAQFKVDLVRSPLDSMSI